MLFVVINYLKSIFVEYGIFMQLMIDNGLQYSLVEFKYFMNVYGVEYIISFFLYF